MYCPACGIKNDPPGLRCFICSKTMPVGDSAERGSASPRPPFRAAASAGDPVGAVGDRMLALILDRILLASLLLIPAAAFAGNWQRLQQSLPSFSSRMSAGILTAALVIFIYHVVLETFLGTTPGKAILGLYVRNESERNNITTAAIRNALRIVDSIALYLVGFLVALFSSKKQRFGDHIASATVMERRLTWPARLALIVLWVSLIGASVWFANLTCPGCSASVPTTLTRASAR